MARSEPLIPAARAALELSRRELLVGGALAFGAAALWPGIARSAADPSWLEVARTSPLVYVSPLHSDGKESRCHGEVWFFVDGGDVVLVSRLRGALERLKRPSIV